MNQEQEQQFAAEVRNYITDYLPLNQLTDEELEEQIEQIVLEKLQGQYCSIEQKRSLTDQIYGSIRGFGILDSILKDESVTEIMINGPDHIFVEKAGALFQLNKQFESERSLEDVIQRIVGLAGREVNQANPICDTRLPDGSRVNVVLSPIALCGYTYLNYNKPPSPAM